MSWVESTDELHVVRAVLTGIVVIVLSGIGLGYGTALVLTEWLPALAR